MARLTQLLSHTVTLFLAWPTAALACPMCKEALFDPAKAERALQAAKGYALSIGLMIGTPMLLVGGLAALIVRHARRHRTTVASKLTP